MRLRSVTVGIIAFMIGMLTLSACGETGQMIKDASNIDVDQVQNSGAEIRAAAKICSEASGRLSPALQDMFDAVKDKDLAAAQSAGAELQSIADELHQSETDGVAASSGLSSLPGEAGTQATDGVSMAFKQCGATGDEAEGLATAIANASEADLDGNLQKEISKVQDQAMQATQDIAGV